MRPDTDTEAEIVLAERYVAVLDYTSRAARALDTGNWRYLWDKLTELHHDRIGCHPKLVERARAALRRSAS